MQVSVHQDQLYEDDAEKDSSLKINYNMLTSKTRES